MNDRVQSLGDRAFLRRFATEVEAAGWACAVRSAQIPGVEEVVLAYETVAVMTTDACLDLDQVEDTLNAVPHEGLSRTSGRFIEIPVLYNGADLDSVAEQLSLTVSDLISIHVGTIYHVYAIGFLPGFPYLGYLDPRIAGLGRLSKPRSSVPAGSVAMVGRQTGVYPGVSPGGWHLIGRTPVRIVDVESDHFPICAGDCVQFIAIDLDEYQALIGEML